MSVGAAAKCSWVPQRSDVGIGSLATGITVIGA